MKNYIQEGRILDVLTPSGGYTSGQIVVVGDLTGVAGSTTVENELCAVSVEGVFEIAKAAGTALTVGQSVYSAAGAAVTTTNTDTFVGHVVEAADSAATVVKVRLSN